MRILHITDHLDSNSGRFVNHATTELLKRGHKVVVYTSDKLIDPAGTGKSNVKVKNFKGIIIGNGGKYFPPRNLFFGVIPKLLFFKKPDIIHSYVLGSFSTTVVSYISFLRRVPLVIEADYNISKKSLLKRGLNLFDKLIPAHLAKYVTVYTKEQKKIICKELFLSKNKVKILPIGVAICNLKRKKNRIFTVIHVGNITPAKNFELFIKIVKSLPEINFIHIGSFYDKKYAERLKDYNLLDNLRFIKSIEHKEIFNWYNKADMFIQTSNYESYGIALLEAMSCNLPVISTPVGLARELRSVMIAHDLDSFVKNIKKISENNNLQNQLKKKIKKEVNFFMWDKIIDKLEILYGVKK